jgi:anaerobic selenocysteine-containing dehydrogenase
MPTKDKNQADTEIKIVRTTSTFDCGGRCPLRLHVKDNRVIRVEGDETPEPEQLRTCPRGYIIQVRTEKAAAISNAWGAVVWRKWWLQNLSAKEI